MQGRPESPVPRSRPGWLGPESAQVGRGILNRHLAREASLETAEATALGAAAVGSGVLTARGGDRVRRVARTIADLAGVERVEEEHMAEAIGLRGEWRDD